MKTKAAVLLSFLFALASHAQTPSLYSDLKLLVETPAVSGYESDLAAKISDKLKAFSPQRDSIGNVVVTIGSGAPHRVIATAIDEPGFVVSGITPDGYLRVQRLPQNGLLPIWNELHSAQPVLVRGRDGGWRNGAVAGLSVHLQPGRQHAPDLGDLDNIYVDVGATSAEEVKTAGIDVLAPLGIDRQLLPVGADKLSAADVEDRFGAAALLQVLHDLDRSKVKGTLTIAFVTQQWLGSRGALQLVENLHPDELLFVGPLRRALNAKQSTSGKTGSGVLISEVSTGDLAQQLQQIARQLNVEVASESAAAVVGGGRLLTPAPKLPPRVAHVGIPVAWLSTPAQYVDGRDLASLTRVVEQYAQGSASAIPNPSDAEMALPTAGSRPSTALANVELIKRLVQAYGVSDHEGFVADEIAALLPPWAKPTKDKSGNLILRWGPDKSGGVVVVAHQDEIGYEVKSIEADGKIVLESKGGGTPAFFAGHQTLIFTSSGIRPAVIALASGWDQADFKWPREAQFPFAADVGATSADEVSKLGIKVGDWATIPKKYRPMIGTRATARSFDDRMGCAALVSAAWKLGPNVNQNVTFVWSTGEELGLLGASAVAQQLAAEGKPPAYVFAIDTFVSSDSPIESKRFGDALVGHGFVVRAVDNSNIVPPESVKAVLKVAANEHIAAQYGVTGGGNDGSAFVRYGVTDVALGWPLRYSHSPAEVIDTKDLDALANIVTAVSRSWKP